ALSDADPPTRPSRFRTARPHSGSSGTADTTPPGHDAPRYGSERFRSRLVAPRGEVLPSVASQSHRWDRSLPHAYTNRRSAVPGQRVNVRGARVQADRRSNAWLGPPAAGAGAASPDRTTGVSRTYSSLCARGPPSP